MSSSEALFGASYVSAADTDYLVVMFVLLVGGFFTSSINLSRIASWGHKPRPRVRTSCGAINSLTAPDVVNITAEGDGEELA